MCPRWKAAIPILYLCQILEMLPSVPGNCIHFGYLCYLHIWCPFIQAGVHIIHIHYINICMYVFVVISHQAIFHISPDLSSGISACNPRADMQGSIQNKVWWLRYYQYCMKLYIIIPHWMCITSWPMKQVTLISKFAHVSHPCVKDKISSKPTLWKKIMLSLS